MFHRLAVPTYAGGLPGGYDYINDPVANGDAGVPAFVGVKKVGGPNDGTWLVAFGEDGTSENANRGLAALAQNTDYIDDILHKDLALTVRTNNATAVGAVASVVISGEVYVAAFGTTNNQEQRNRLISVLDANDNEIIDSSGATVQASLIHDGASNNVLGTATSGFYTNPTISFSPAIPDTTVYRVYYGERANLAELPVDAFTDVRIRGAQEVDGGVEKQLRDLHAPGAIQAWDAPFDATIQALARSGLNERYRRSTLVVSGNYNVAGDGATIDRDGSALTIALPNHSRTANTLSTAWPDPILACYRVKGDASLADNAFPPASRNFGGDVGLYQESDLSSTAATGEWNRARIAGPLLLDAIPRDVRADTLDGSATLTRISSIANATINPTSGATTTARRTIQCATGQYFRNASAGGRTAIRVGIDLLEVQTNAGVPVGTYVISAITADNQVLVTTLMGGSPAFPTVADATVRIRWIQPTVSLGGAVAAGLSSAPEGTYRSLLVAQSSPLTDVPSNNNHQVAALFLAAYARREEAYDVSITDAALERNMTAFAWGGAVKTGGTPEINGRLLGDGSIVCEFGRQAVTTINRRVHSESVPDAGGSYILNPLLDGSVYNFTAAGTFSAAAPLDITLASDYTPLDGDEIVLHFKFPSSAHPERLVVSLPSEFRIAENALGAPFALTGFVDVDCVLVARRVGSEFVVTSFPVAFEKRLAIFKLSGTNVANGSAFTLTSTTDPFMGFDYTLTTDQIFVPAPGVYLVRVMARLRSASGTSNIRIGTETKLNGVGDVNRTHTALRLGTDTAVEASSHGEHILVVSDATHPIIISATNSASGTTTAVEGTVSIEHVRS
jgi:hypothetical protein